MTSRKTEAISSLDLESNQPLLANEDYDDHDNKKKQKIIKENKTSESCACDGKKIVSIVMLMIVLSIVYDASMRSPEDRFLKPDLAGKFLVWVEANPYWGLIAFLCVIAVCVVLLIPIGTPLTLGCGYIYKGVYGWTMGLAVATFVSMAGSALGAVLCFLLGRYLMRDRVRQWVRQYPLFDAIDMAVSEHGLRIMAMLYLTPVLPLGPVSYMCGSTSMALSSFVIAKIASLPLMLLYVYIGATAGTLLLDTEAIEHNLTLMISGVLLSACMITGITYYIRKELMTILEKQKSKISDATTAVHPEPPPNSGGNSSAATAKVTNTTSSSSSTATGVSNIELPTVSSPSSLKKPLKQRHGFGIQAPNLYGAPIAEENSVEKDK